MINNEIEDRLKHLNDKQKEAVIDQSKNLLVLAGAGSGKTRVITEKIVYSIRELGLKPWEILGVTFTNKACREMRERIERMLPEIDINNMNLRTFHSFGVWLLRRWGSRIGLSSDFQIYDDDDSTALLAQCYPNEKKQDLKKIAHRISYYKDKMQEPTNSNNVDNFKQMYYAYQEKLEKTGNVDFADLILRTLELLDKDEEVRSWVQNKFKLILVDEYQDSNLAQFQMLRRIVGSDTRLCVVGDDDQSIYSFRGAEVKNILSFPKVFPKTTTIKLEQNYRSTKNILAVAYDVISNNKGRSEKKLWTSNASGNYPILHYVNTPYSEAYSIAKILKQRGFYTNCAVLYRTNAQSSVLEQVFNKEDIPYVLVGSVKFFNREEVRDAVSLMGFLLNPRDSVAFARVINKPPRGFGKVSLTNILDMAPHFDGDLIKCAQTAIEGKTIKGKALLGLSQFVNAYNHVRELTDKNENNSNVMKSIIELFGLKDYYKDRDDKEGNVVGFKRLENLEQLVNLLTREDYSEGIEGINAFLESAALEPTELDKDGNSVEEQKGVTLITMHNTKGLEFDNVFIVGLEEGLFPSSKSIESLTEIEEERRIFYVSITRARKELHMFSCKSRQQWGQEFQQRPSRFLREIQKEHIFEKDETRIDSSIFSEKKSFPTFEMPNFEKRNSYLKQPSNNKKPVRAAWDSPKPKLIKKNVGSNSPKVDYKTGDKIFSPNYGEGKITNLRNFAGRTVMDVSFSDGRKASFAADKVNFKKIQ